MILVSALALAGGAHKQPLGSKKQLVGDHSAQSLRLGEVMLGTSGLAMGVLPRVQVGTRATLNLVGLPNGEVKLQLIDRPNVDVSVDGLLMQSTLAGFDADAWGAGANASLHKGRFSLHSGVHYTSFGFQGVPTESPPLVVQIAGQDPLAEIPPEFSDLADVGFRWQAATLRTGIELRVFGRSGLLLQGSLSMGGQFDIRAGATIEGTSIDIGHALPGVNMLKASTTPGGSWVTSAAWQQVLGPFHLRAGIGISAIPYAWVTQAMSLQMRLGGFRLKRSHPAGRMAEARIKRKDRRALRNEGDAMAEIPTEEPSDDAYEEASLPVDIIFEPNEAPAAPETVYLPDPITDAE
ncbi:MAG: hypothetical protein AAGA48_34655 [Myxococcota bacterium]